MGLKQVLLLLNLLFCLSISAQIVPVGSGSYTKTLPGKDAAGRNSEPSGTPQLSGTALGKPVPTNDWWSKLIKEKHADNLFSHPYTLKTVNSGLVVSYIPRGVIDDLLPVTMGVVGLSAGQATVSDYSDWTVTMNWKDAAHEFSATAGSGMPFLYFTKKTSDVAQVRITSGNATINNEMLIIANAKNGASFAVYAPQGSTWTGSSGVYTSTLNGKNYWSMAFIPLTATNVASVANEYKKYAYVFPVNTTATWSYDENTAVVRTDFAVQTEVKEGTEANVLLGLYPHQWANLAPDSPIPDKYTYPSVRGEIKTLAGNYFSVENTFHGILPTLPYVHAQSVGFDADQLAGKIATLEDEILATWTDSYNEGQVMNRLIQTARIADETGNTTARNKILATIKERLEDWLTAESEEVAFVFYYNTTWSALLGYPAGHGQDNNLNDHHFHWGYFIHAAAFVEQYQPGWADHWGPMINLLVRDAANTDRNDPLFPFMRNFSPYAGHSWANGFATFPQGNDQESTSESMQFNSSLIHWGSVTDNRAIRDLGIYLYTTEQTAIEEYWFDMYDRNFPSTQQYRLVSRVWGNDLDNGTFWTNDIAASYGIELYPVSGGSLYLGHNTEYAAKLWNEIERNTSILQNQANDNLWHDVMWEYLSFIDAAKAIKLYDSYPDRSLKFGISDAQTYYWLHAMNALGEVDASITSDYPVAAAFIQNGVITYVAQNYTNSLLTVTFSTGYELNVPARKMAFGKAGNPLPVVSIISPESDTEFSIGEEITITATVVDNDGGGVQKVDFYQNGNWIGTDNTAPYSISWSSLEAGRYALTAKATNNAGKEGTSKAVNIKVSGACSQTSTEASQGSFSEGYFAEFETLGTEVSVVFELLDTDKTGIVAYLWTENPFSEKQMTNIGGQRFSVSLNGQTAGTILSLACKFAYAGGMSVTKYISYTVGDNCAGIIADDTEAPSGFTVEVGLVTHNSIELLLNATDNSGYIKYEIAYGAGNKITVQGISATQKSYVVKNLIPDSSYPFSITAKDASGNIAANSPLSLTARTLEIANTHCSGTSDEATQGAFSTGYKYNFETNGTSVTVTFEMLDDKIGVVAYAWTYNPNFAETKLTNTDGKVFSTTFNNRTIGETFKIACKFESSGGGLDVTKTFEYIVGANCDGANGNIKIDAGQKISIYPNPATDKIILKSVTEISEIMIINVLGRTVKSITDINSNEHTIDISAIPSGNYIVIVKTSDGKLTTTKIIKHFRALSI
ncbi:MAG: T9SS type A sorting domain-containing protein [Dysgonamonadaceae bacterium]|nr:T9SS type A sorting domain-containing protein [Dysgonamonadaceae bacterium]